MKIRTTVPILCVVGLALLAGCATPPETSVIAVRLGMTRDNVKLHFGEPLRIESLPSGGENWYYRFAIWNPHPTSESGTTIELGQPTSYATSSFSFSKETQERPIHISAEGFVVEPLPDGKVVKAN